MMARLLALTMALAGPSRAPLAAEPATSAPPLLRASAEQNLVVEASGDPRRPHLFAVEGSEAQRRPWVVSINAALDGAVDLDRRLVQELDTQRLADQVLLEAFRPPHKPRCIELQVGSRVPVSLVQAVVRSLLPMSHRWSVQFAEDDEASGAGTSQRIYVGGMVQRACTLAPPARLRELTTPGLTPEQLHRLLRSIDGTLRQHARAAWTGGHTGS